MADDPTPDEQPSEASTEAADEDLEAPPGLPEIREEAADTPRWVPLLGLALLVALFAVFGMQVLSGSDEGDAPGTEDAAGEAPEPGAEGAGEGAQ